jgi:hypothetical protein
MNFKDKARQNLATAFSYDLCGGEGIQYAVYVQVETGYCEELAGGN